MATMLILLSIGALGVYIMSQIDDLNDSLAAISAAVEDVAGDVARLVEELAIANQNPGVDLTATLENARAIQARLEGLAAENVPDED